MEEEEERFRGSKAFSSRAVLFWGRAFKYSSGVFASSCLLVTHRIVVSSKVGSQRHSAPITAIIARFPPSILASSPFDLTPSRPFSTSSRHRLDITYHVIILEHINSKYFVSVYIATSFCEIPNVDSFLERSYEYRTLLSIRGIRYLNGTIPMGYYVYRLYQDKILDLISFFFCIDLTKTDLIISR